MRLDDLDPLIGFFTHKSGVVSTFNEFSNLGPKSNPEKLLGLHG